MFVQQRSILSSEYDRAQENAGTRFRKGGKAEPNREAGTRGNCRETMQSIASRCGSGAGMAPRALAIFWRRQPSTSKAGGCRMLHGGAGLLLPPGQENTWPVDVVEIENKGRGLKATCRIRKGDVVFAEQPFLLVYSGSALSEPRAANGKYFDIFSLPRVSALEEALVRNKRNHPRHVIRLISRIIGDLQGDPQGGAGATWGRLRQLCRASFPAEDPEEWQAELGSIRDAMCFPADAPGGIGAETFDMIFTRQWYRDCMAILALNTMSLAAPPPNTDEASPPLKSSALFLTASLLNHSCSPNIAVRCDGVGGSQAGGGGVSFSFVADKDIAPGTELCISYVDTGMDTVGRVEELYWNYGFKCTCSRCKGVQVTLRDPKP